jgi:AcrR family transcriptional regulator
MLSDTTALSDSEGCVGVRERRERQKETMRQEILDAARDLFVEQGYQNVSMRKIGEKIEYSPTTIYLYFKDKAELLYCICEETFARLLATLEAIVETDSDPVSCLERGLRAYVEFGLDHPNHYIMSFLTPHDHGDLPEAYSYENSTGARAFDLLRTMVRRCVEGGYFRPVDVESTAQALWASVHGVTSLLIVDKEFPFVERTALVDRLVDMTIRSLRA